ERRNGDTGARWSAVFQRPYYDVFAEMELKKIMF
ncbi:hypothetical protein EVAR_19057_1, partial [Eumeta japonica]